MDRQECLSYAGLKSSTQGLYLLNMPWYTLRAQRVEQVGRSLLEPSFKSFIFGLHLKLSGSNLGPGEESPNTAGQRAR